MNVDEELKTYLQVLWRYKWMIVACAFFPSLVALVISYRLTPLYSATATVRVASAPGGAADYTYLSSITRLSNTYVEIANSDVSLDEVAKRLGLQKQPEVEVEVVPETELIEINATDPDPARARDIANTLADLMAEQSMQLYGGDTPTAREILEGQLQQAKADLDTALQEYESALRSAQSYATPSVDSASVPDPYAETLARIVSVRQQIYTDLLLEYESARTKEQLRANAITIVEPAYLPQKPAKPKVPLNAALGLLVGLAMGVILAFLLEGMDDTLRGIEDIREITGAPILCRIPELRRRLGTNANLSFFRDGRHSLAPAFDQLSARLILLTTKRKSTTFLITSPEPGTGKSTVSANLAVSLAEGGNRVVLVDMDLYRPRLHSIFDLPNGKGLGNYMHGEIPLDLALQKTSRPNLRVVTAGSSQLDPSEWLSPMKIGSLIESLGKECDYAVIDAPALLSVADPTVVAPKVDAVVFVVARRKTTRQDLRLALQQITELKAKTAGIVVNKMPDSPLYRYYSERHPKQLSSQNLRLALQQLTELKAKVAGIVVNKMPDSPLYRYYSERHPKQLSSLKGEPATDIAVNARSNSSGEEPADTAPQLQNPY